MASYFNTLLGETVKKMIFGMYYMLSLWFQWSITIVSWILEHYWNQTPSCHFRLWPNHTLTRCQDTSRSVLQHDKERNKTYSVLYHRPVWITLNSFIWNIKTMKHKPSTKSDSNKWLVIRLLKMNRLYWKTSRLLSLNDEADTQSRQVRCEHDCAIYTLQILPDSRRTEKEKKKREENGNGDIRLTTAEWLWPGI